jgi:hypothetical protein
MTDIHDNEIIHLYINKYLYIDELLKELRFEDELLRLKVCPDSNCPEGPHCVCLGFQGPQGCIDTCRSESAYCQLLEQSRFLTGLFIRYIEENVSLRNTAILIYDSYIAWADMMRRTNVQFRVAWKRVMDRHNGVIGYEEFLASYDNTQLDDYLDDGRVNGSVGCGEGIIERPLRPGECGGGYPPLRPLPYDDFNIQPIGPLRIDPCYNNDIRYDKCQIQKDENNIRDDMRQMERDRQKICDDQAKIQRDEARIINDERRIAHDVAMLQREKEQLRQEICSGRTDPYRIQYQEQRICHEEQRIQKDIVELQHDRVELARDIEELRIDIMELERDMQELRWDQCELKDDVQELRYDQCFPPLRPLPPGRIDDCYPVAPIYPPGRIDDYVSIQPYPYPEYGLRPGECGGGYPPVREEWHGPLRPLPYPEYGLRPGERGGGYPPLRPLPYPEYGLRPLPYPEYGMRPGECGGGYPPLRPLPYPEYPVRTGGPLRPYPEYPARTGWPLRPMPYPEYPIREGAYRGEEMILRAEEMILRTEEIIFAELSEPVQSYVESYMRRSKKPYSHFQKIMKLGEFRSDQVTLDVAKKLTSYMDKYDWNDCGRLAKSLNRRLY